jgi:hypothetical protein
MKTINNKLSFFVFLTICICLLVASIFLRAYHFSQMTDWWGDPGGDLLVARNILYHGHRPLIGSFLTVNNFNLPPTYYYLMTVFLLLAKSPLGVAYIFFILNIISGILLSCLARKIIDKTTGLILLFLFTFSNIMIIHGRSIYQTYLVLPFLALSLYLMWSARSSRNIWYLIGSVFSFGIAATIYPSPWLLSPYMLLTVHDYFRHSQSAIIKKYSVIYTILLTGLIIFPLYIPQFIFELREGFPTLLVIIQHSGKLPGAANWIGMYTIYLYQLFNQLFCIESIIKPPFSFSAAMIIMGLFCLMLILAHRSISYLPKNRAEFYAKAFSFTNSMWVALSLLFMIIFWENAYHRLSIFFPFVFLLFSFCLRLALEVRHVWFRIIISVVFCLYVIGNASAIWNMMTGPKNNYLAKTEEVVRYIIADTNKQKIINNDYGVLYYTPYGYGNYNLPSVLYFLQKDAGYPVKFLKAGNDIDRYGINTASFNVVYLICGYFRDISESDALCRNKFLEKNPMYYLQNFISLPLGYLYVFIR